MMHCDLMMACIFSGAISTGTALALPSRGMTVTCGMTNVTSISMSHRALCLERMLQDRERDQTQIRAIFFPRPCSSQTMTFCAARLALISALSAIVSNIRERRASAEHEQPPSLFLLSRRGGWQQWSSLAVSFVLSSPIQANFPPTKPRIWYWASICSQFPSLRRLSTRVCQKALATATISLST